ncbi:hypothetical protein GCM10007067_25740 [Lysobacter bugurensis]|uniref:Uncharacterized protein n=1 Tax=Cognatilysobacter bugurensis TaxID=543356 RepID=A0A918T4H4_9GAMM|nr:hypothetical protein GCM10007067_25740 [Lysobacter bugurensis]
MVRACVFLATNGTGEGARVGAMLGWSRMKGDGDACFRRHVQGSTMPQDAAIFAPLITIAVVAAGSAAHA